MKHLFARARRRGARTFFPLPVSVRPTFAACLATALLLLFGCAPEAEAPADEPVSDVAASGQAMYQSYCASCHGPEAHGDGPVASLLTVPPPDLTRIRERRGGAFPVDDLYQMIDGREAVQAHGTREMPIWGNAWGTNSPQSEENVRQRISLLIEYLRTIQVEDE